MSLKSVLKPDGSVLVGLAEAAAVYVIYTNALPNHADIRTAPAGNTDVESARKKAAWSAGAVLGFVFLLTQDLNSFLIGGLSLATIDLMAKHANGTNPATGKLAPGASSGPSASAAITTGTDGGGLYPLPDYADANVSVSY